MRFPFYDIFPKKNPLPTLLGLITDFKVFLAFINYAIISPSPKQGITPTTRPIIMSTTRLMLAKTFFIKT